jgi:hypothetical protein
MVMALKRKCMFVILIFSLLLIQTQTASGQPSPASVYIEMKDADGNYIYSKGCSNTPRVQWNNIHMYVYNETGDRIISQGSLGCNISISLNEGNYRIEVIARRDNNQQYWTMYNNSINVLNNTYYYLSTTDMALIGMTLQDAEDNYLSGLWSEGCPGVLSKITWQGISGYVYNETGDLIYSSGHLGCKTSFGLKTGTYRIVFIGMKDNNQQWWTLYNKTVTVNEGNVYGLSSKDMALVGITVLDAEDNYLSGLWSEGCSGVSNKITWQGISAYVYSESGDKLFSSGHLGCRTTFALNSGTYRIIVTGLKDDNQRSWTLYNKTLVLNEGTIYKLSTKDMALIGVTIQDAEDNYLSGLWSEGCSGVASKATWHGISAYVYNESGRQLFSSGHLGCRTTFALNDGTYRIVFIGMKDDNQQWWTLYNKTVTVNEGNVYGLSSKDMALIGMDLQDAFGNYQFGEYSEGCSASNRQRWQNIWIHVYDEFGTKIHGTSHIGCKTSFTLNDGTYRIMVQGRLDPDQSEWTLYNKTISVSGGIIYSLSTNDMALVGMTVLDDIGYHLFGERSEGCSEAQRLKWSNLRLYVYDLNGNILQASSHIGCKTNFALNNGTYRLFVNGKKDPDQNDWVLFNKTITVNEGKIYLHNTSEMALVGMTFQDELGNYMFSTRSEGCRTLPRIQWNAIAMHVYDDTGNQLFYSNHLGCKTTFALQDGSYRIEVEGQKDPDQAYVPLFDKNVTFFGNKIYELSTVESALLGINVIDFNGTSLYSERSDGCSNPNRQQWYRMFLYVYDYENNLLLYDPLIGCRTTIGLKEGLYNITLLGIETPSSPYIYASDKRYFSENATCSITANLEKNTFEYDCIKSDPYVFRITPSTTNIYQIIGESWNYSFDLENVAPYDGNFSFSIQGIDASWYSSYPSNIFLKPTESSNFIINIDTPDYYQHIGYYPLNLSVMRDTGTEVIVPLNLTLTTTFETPTNMSDIIISPGHSVEHYIDLNNLAYFLGDFAVTLEGLQDGWFAIDQEQMSVAGLDSDRIRITFSPPADCGLLGNYPFNVTVARDNGEQKTLYFNLVVGSDPVITGLYPINGTRFDSDSVYIAWETDVPGSTEVYFRQSNTNNYTVLQGSFGYTHSIVLNNLSVNTTYKYYVRTTNLCGLIQSEERTFLIDEAEPAISYNVVEFMSLPDYIITNIPAFPVNGRKTSAVTEVYVNGNRLHASTKQFVTVFDLAVGINDITLKLVYSNGSNHTYTKQIEYDPNYDTTDMELVYANTAYTIDDVGTTERGILVIDAKLDGLLGLIRNSMVRGVIGNGKEIVVDDGQRWSTASHTFTNRTLPGFVAGYKVLSSKDGKYVYHLTYIIDYANNSLAGSLPANIREFGSLTSDGNTIIFYSGKIDLSSNTFISMPFTSGQVKYMGGFAGSPDGNFAASSSYSYAASLLNFFDANTGTRIGRWGYYPRGYPSGDFAGDIVFSPDSKKMYATFYGNSYYGGGGVSLIDTQAVERGDWQGMYGARSAAISKDGDVYVSAISGPDYRGVVKFVTEDGGTDIIIRKVYFSNMVGRYLGHIHYKPGIDIVCYSDQDCDIDEFVGSGFCQNDDVFMEYATYSCVNPGTDDAYCTSEMEARLVEECGVTSYDVWGQGYCSGGVVHQDRIAHERGCSASSCYHNLVTETKTGVTFEGDVNGDNAINIFDLAIVGMAYGSQPGDTNWYVKADINIDNTVNIFDLAIVGMNYERTC